MKKSTRSFLTLIATLSFTSLAQAEYLRFWRDNTESSTRATWERHIKAWTARDLDAIISDYTHDAVLIRNDEVYRGPAEIRLAFARLFAHFDQATATDINRVTFENEVVYITWWADFPARESRTFGTDTFVIHNGRIRTQTIAEF